MRRPELIFLHSANADGFDVRPVTFKSSWLSPKEVQIHLRWQTPLPSRSGSQAASRRRCLRRVRAVPATRRVRAVPATRRAIELARMPMVEPLPSWSVHAQPAVAEVQIGDVEADKLIRMERAGEAEQAQGAVAQALQIPPPTVATIATTRSAGRRGPCRLACCPQDSREQPQLRSCGLVHR
jgi:hypothetical protein